MILKDVTNPYILASRDIQGIMLSERMKSQKNILYNIHVKNIYTLKYVLI